VANIGSTLSWPVFLIGLWLNMGPLLYAGIIFFGAAVLFQLVTVPVELNASARVLNILENNGILGADEMKGAKRVLTAAALTYLASLLASLLQLIRLLLLANGRRRDWDANCT